MATTIVSGVQYSGIWTMQQVNSAISAGTWPVAYGPQVLYGWGSNANGQLGLGNRTSYSSPKQVGALVNWLNLASGGYNSLATKTDGTLWAWGSNSDGQLGLGNTTYYSSPKQVGSLTYWSAIAGGAGGSNQTIATKTDGTLWSWGRNNLGQLGLGNTTSYSSPKQIGALTTWSLISCKASAVISIKTDGTLWGWGRNNSGQLGLGNITDYSSPKQVGASTTWQRIASSGGFTLAIATT